LPSIDAGVAALVDEDVLLGLSTDSSFKGGGASSLMKLM
jgi:hypothetical protein